MVAWTAEKDQLLLKGVFQFCDIKTSGPLLQHLAELIGEGCTPKAVSHRLNNIKNTGKMTRDPSATPSKGTPARGTPAKITKSTPTSGRGRGRPPKNYSEEPDNELGSASPTAGRKRGRKPKDENKDENNGNKKIKTEAAEEESFQDVIEEGD